MIVSESRDESASCAVALSDREPHARSDEVSPEPAPTTDASLCLADERGNVLAATAAGREWLDRAADRAQLREAIGRLLASESSAEPSSQISGDVQLNRLDGPSGPLVLITVRQPEALDATVHDALTQLPDRRALTSRAEAWRRAGAPAGARYAVLFLDLDDFKVVNDRHGHAIGDAVLQTLAGRWQQCIRDGDLLVRYGGDEFVLLLQNATTAAEVQPVIRRLRDATSAPIAINDLTLNVSATVGWASSVDFDGALDATIAAADRDMYAGKRRVIG
jgi:diguanylate cyclase (GGDEF)-like protein